jgi:1,4-dihydroxy-2-naphthoyl-CoA hydrolase
MTAAAESDTALVRRFIPLCATLGVRTETYRAGEVVLALDWAPALCTSGGLLHGGVVMALADSAGALGAFLNLPEGATGTATIESKTNFLAAVRSGVVRARSRPLHVGSRTIVVETDVRADPDRLAARVTQTQAVL